MYIYIGIWKFAFTEMFYLKHFQSDEFWQMQSRCLTDPYLKLYKTFWLAWENKSINFTKSLEGLGSFYFGRNYNKNYFNNDVSWNYRYKTSGELNSLVFNHIYFTINSLFHLLSSLAV